MNESERAISSIRSWTESHSDQGYTVKFLFSPGLVGIRKPVRGVVKWGIALSKPKDGGTCKWGIVLFSTSGPEKNINARWATRSGVEFCNVKRRTQSQPGLSVFDSEVYKNG